MIKNNYMIDNIYNFYIINFTYPNDNIILIDKGVNLLEITNKYEHFKNKIINEIKIFSKPYKNQYAEIILNLFASIIKFNFENFKVFVGNTHNEISNSNVIENFEKVYNKQYYIDFYKYYNKFINIVIKNKILNYNFIMPTKIESNGDIIMWKY